MSESVTRPEFEARIDAMRQEMRADGTANRAATGEQFVALSESVGRLDERMKHVESSLAGLPIWLAGTGLAVVLGIAAFNATVLSNMVASFESGKNTTAAMDAVANRVDAASSRIERLQAAIEAAAARPPAPATSSAK